MNHPPASHEPIKSEFADDPDMMELIELFLQELPERLAAFSDALAAGDISIVQRVSHQLRGSSAGYGFPKLGRAAAEVEDLIREASPPLTGITPELAAKVRHFESVAASVMVGAARKAA